MYTTAHIYGITDCVKTTYELLKLWWFAVPAKQRKKRADVVTSEEFFKRDRELYADLDDLSDFIYAGMGIKGKVICLKDKDHGEYWQTPHARRAGHRCPKCGIKMQVESNQMSKEAFLKRDLEIFGPGKDEYIDIVCVKQQPVSKFKCLINSEHGVYSQKTRTRLEGHRCPKCGNDSKLITWEEFLKRDKNINGDLDSFEKAEFKGMNVAIKIDCYFHGEYLQRPRKRLEGHRCRKCGTEKCSALTRHTLDSLLERFKALHGDKYDYSLIKEAPKNINICVPIVCKVPGHGVFMQTPHSHFSGNSEDCPKCSNECMKKLNSYTQKEFVEKVEKVLGKNTYDLSKFIYSGVGHKSIVICPIQGHGEFIISAGNLLSGQKCPLCTPISSGEHKIKLFLNSLSILWESQKKFSDCKDKKALPFDFYLPAYNTLIEYDGQLHYKATEYFGGIKHLQITKYHDRIKTEYAKTHGFRLIRIKYTQFDNIEKILTKKLGLTKSSRLHSQKP